MNRQFLQSYLYLVIILHLSFLVGQSSVGSRCLKNATYKRISPRTILVSPHIRESRSFVSLKAAIIKFDAPLRLYSTNLACVASRRVAPVQRARRNKSDDRVREGARFYAP